MSGYCRDCGNKHCICIEKSFKTIWHTPEDYPEIYKHVLLYVRLDCTVFGKKIFNEYMIEGYYSPDYDTGEPSWYDWSGDKIFGDEKVIRWCEVPE